MNDGRDVISDSRNSGQAAPNDNIPDGARSGQPRSQHYRKAIGAFSLMAILAEGRHALHVLHSCFAGAHAISNGLVLIWNLPDLQFAGFLFYAGILVSAIAGLIWAVMPYICKLVRHLRSRLRLLRRRFRSRRCK